MTKIRVALNIALVMKFLKSSFYFCFFLCLIKVSAQDTTTINALNDKAFKTVYNNVEEGLNYAKEAVANSKKIGFCRGEVKGYIRMGIAYELKTKFDSSLYAYKLAKERLKDCEYLKGTLSVNNNIGLIYFKEKKMNDALGYFIPAFQSAQKLNDFTSMAKIINNIGLVNQSMQNFKEALSNFKEAEIYYEKSSVSEEVGSVYTNLGLVYDCLGNNEKAIFYTKKSLENHRKRGDAYGESLALKNIAAIYSDLKDETKAIEYYLMAVKIHQRLKDKFSEASTRFNISSSYVKLGNFGNAKEEIEKAEALSRNFKDKVFNEQVLLRKALIQEALGNYKEASELKSQANRLRDSISTEGLSKNLAEASVKFQTEQTQLKASFYARESKIKQQALEKEKSLRNLLIGLCIITILLALCIIVVLRRNNERKASNLKLQSELKMAEIKNEERKRISLDLHDNVGAQLAYVTGNLDLIEMKREINNEIDFKKLKDVNAMSKQAILTLRETVWALSSEQISVNQFTTRFKSFADSMIELSPNMTFKMNTKLEHDETMTTHKALNAFRICQEAFNNSVRHSEGTHIDISFENNAKKLLVASISDNGIGYHLETALAKNHHGLVNLKTRANDIDGELICETKIGGGTKVILIL